MSAAYRCRLLRQRFLQRRHQIGDIGAIRLRRFADINPSPLSFASISDRNRVS
jgi:hypothetical protein